MNNTSKLALSFLCASQLSSYSAVVINNLANGTQGVAVGLTGPDAVSLIISLPDPNRQVGFSFTTGSTVGNLTGLEAVLNVTDNSSPITVLLSTGPNVPGPIPIVSVATVTPPSQSSSFPQALVDFSPAAPIPLNANTTYWLRFLVPTGSASFGFYNSNTPTVAPGWSLNNTWTKQDADPWFEITSGSRAQVSLDFEPVPEPSAALLGGVGFLLLLGRRGR